MLPLRYTEVELVVRLMNTLTSSDVLRTHDAGETRRPFTDIYPPIGDLHHSANTP